MIKIKKQSLLKGTFILVIAGFSNKVLGFLLRLILVRVIGDEGLGLFQMVFPIFISFSIITTLGFPVALSKFIPTILAKKNKENALNLFFSALLVTFVSSIVITLLFISLSAFIAENILNDSRTYYILLVIAPALIFAALASVLRGFFQGFRLMTPTATSQIIEQVFRITATLVILYKVINQSLEVQATGVALGISIGQLFGFLTLVIFFIHYIKLKDIRLSYQQVKISTAKLIKFGIPITLGRLIASLLYSIEAATIPGQLQQSGYSLSQATGLYGQLAGMVQQLIYLPTIITLALNTNLIPNISEYAAQNKYQIIKNKLQNIIKLISYLGFLTTAIFITLATEICDLLFSYPQAARPLRILAITAVFLYLGQSFSGILHGLGKPKQVVINLIIALTIELLLIHSATSVPKEWSFIVITAAIGIRYFITALLHFRSINQIVKIRLYLADIIVKPLLATAMILLLLPKLYNLFFYMTTSNFISLLVTITFSTIFFFAFLILTNGITKKDLERFIPKI